MGKEGRSLPVHRDGKFCYEIRLEQDFERLPECVEALGVRGRRLCIVTDSHAGPLYAEAVREKLAKVFGKVTVWTVEAGEENKTLDTVRALYEHLILEHFDRKDMLAALGAGLGLYFYYFLMINATRTDLKGLLSTVLLPSSITTTRYGNILTLGQ